jgi:hypothetical protein
MPWRHQFQTTGSIVFTPGRLIWAERAGADYGCGLYIGDFSACWVGDRGPHYPHDLAQPTIPSSRGMVAHDLARREDLVRDFILAASRTYWRRDHQQRAETVAEGHCRRKAAPRAIRFLIRREGCRHGEKGSAGLIAILRLFRRPYRVEHDLRIGGLCQRLCHFVAVIALVGVVAAKFF